MQYQNIEIHGAAELSEVEGGVSPCRFPANVRERLSDSAKQGAALHMDGMELRFVPTDEVKITLSTKNAGAVNNAVLYYGSVQSGWETLEVRITDTPKAFTFKPSPRLATLQQMRDAYGMPFAPTVLRVMLDHSPIVIHDVKGEVRPPRADELPRAKGIFYGSSITHGSLACTPNMFWARRVAEALGCDHNNYGLAGNCRLEKEVADWFADRTDWDWAHFELGINVVWEYTPDTFRAKVRYLLETVHAAHPEKYIFCTDIFYWNDDFKGENRSDVLRRVVTEEVARLGSDKVIHIAGTDMLPDLSQVSEDLVHPAADGVATIAHNLTAALRRYF